ncbi:Putative transport protein YdiK [Rubrivivax sp. A210]|uniref:AI-2E family transporter YdiK n=1 Tax=Rubrivivax sp. A210 TaxID=2772301 RepID=UPI00191A6196|nr:AI-2E family transporter YdiK [Rubrivivax sp. A210]CAD5374340.1 Putative transport protein YdiK [Rubrivivax sp. A210]
MGEGEPNDGQGGQGAQRAGDLTRTTFAVLFIGALLGVSLWVLRPFLGPTIWATMIVVASWPLMLRIEARLWRRRGLAVAAMTAILLLLFIVPLTLAIVTIVDNADRLVDWAQIAAGYHLPAAPPAWLVDLPLVGGVIERAWSQATALGLRELLPRLSPYAGNLTRWFAAQVGSVGLLLLQVLMTVLIAAVLYATGEGAADHVRRFARRLGGERAVGAVALAGGAIRGVALGVGITAAVQAVLGGLGLALAGVPFAGLLTALSFMLCIAQIGVLPVLVPAAIWLFWGDQTGWGVFMLVWTAIVATLDNVLRPWLIKLGADLPLLLIFAGVIGGLLAFGLVGIFVGPVVLAVAYTLLETWMGDLEPPLTTPPVPPPPETPADPT